jgi:hypothetical protein
MIQSVAGDSHLCDRQVSLASHFLGAQRKWIAEVERPIDGRGGLGACCCYPLDDDARHCAEAQSFELDAIDDAPASCGSTGCRKPPPGSKEQPCHHSYCK